MHEVVFYRTDPDGKPLTIRGLQWWSWRTWPMPTLMGLTEERADEIARCPASSPNPSSEGKQT